MCGPGATPQHEVSLSVAVPSHRRYSPAAPCRTVVLAGVSAFDRGGIEMCVRPSLNARPIELHRLWDELITSSGNARRVKMAVIRRRGD